jgi:hypothetical protein
MSQTSSATAPARPGPSLVPAVTAPTPTAPTPLGTTPAEVAQPARNTPAQLRRLRNVVVASTVVLAILGTTAMVLLTLTLRQAADDVEQLVRVQTIQTDLLVADANATNTFLVGGLESPQRRAAYDDALAEVAGLVSQAAQAQPADADALAALNTHVLDYAGLVEAARANNRQGLPVGAQYLREASNGLRADALPVADALVQANTARSAAALTTGWGWVVPLLALAALVLLVVVQLRVARQFKRRLNAGLLVSSLLLLGLTVTSFALMIILLLTTADSRSSFDDASNVGTARVQANLAKSSESLTLIARGSGQPYEDAWKAADAQVVAHLPLVRDSALFTQQWQAYEQVHTQIRSLDDGGSWDGAVQVAVGSAQGSSNAAFAPFDEQAASYVSRAGGYAVSNLRQELPGLVAGCFLTFLAGLGAAWFGSRGIAARLREYR